MASLTVGDDALGRAVSLISAFCGHPLGAPAKGASTSAKTSEGVVTGLAACATALAAKSPAAAELLGHTAAEKAQVEEWLTWCATELGLLLDDKLAKVGPRGGGGGGSVGGARAASRRAAAERGAHLARRPPAAGAASPAPRAPAPLLPLLPPDPARSTRGCSRAPTSWAAAPRWPTSP
jgi:glutathione S-transferase